MKRFLVAALLAVLLVSLAALLALPSRGSAAKPAASQYGKNAPTGQYLDLFGCNNWGPVGIPCNPFVQPPVQGTYPGNTPFHLSGGWSKGFDSKTSDVEFVSDGVLLSNTDGLTFTYKDGKVGTRWVRNFPDGLASGTHVLTINYVGCPSTPGPISESGSWNACTLSMEVTFS